MQPGLVDSRTHLLAYVSYYSARSSVWGAPKREPSRRTTGWHCPAGGGAVVFPYNPVRPCTANECWSRCTSGFAGTVGPTAAAKIAISPRRPLDSTVSTFRLFDVSTFLHPSPFTLVFPIPNPKSPMGCPPALTPRPAHHRTPGEFFMCRLRPRSLRDRRSRCAGIRHSELGAHMSPERPAPGWGRRIVAQGQRRG